MKDIDVQAHRFQRSPATHSESYLLQHATFRLGIIKLACDATIAGAVERMVGVEEKKIDPSYPCAPHAQLDRPPRQVDRNAQPPSTPVTNRKNRQHGGIVI